MRIATVDGVAVSGADHSAASVERNPKSSGSALKRRLASSVVTTKKLPDGIAPRDFQLLMAGIFTPTSSATAAVPPKASTMASTELSIAPDTSRLVKMSRVYVPVMDGSQNVSFNKGMDCKEVIARRLDLWIKASGETAADICEKIGILESAMSNFRSGVRPLTLAVADKLCDEYQLTLDWIFRSKTHGIEYELRQKMKEIENEEARAASVALPRRVRKRT